MILLNVVMRNWRRKLAGTVRADPPINDLRLVDLEAVIVSDTQARRLACDAVDIDGL